MLGCSSVGRFVGFVFRLDSERGFSGNIYSAAYPEIIPGRLFRQLFFDLTQAVRNGLLCMFFFPAVLISSLPFSE